MKLNKFLAPAALLVAMMIAAPAAADSEFLFNGYSVYGPPGKDQVGAEREVYGILSSVGGIPTPIVLDTDNFEYTIHIFGQMVVGVVEYTIPFPRKEVVFDGGTIHIWADAVTAADYASPGTFVDGELILIASVDDGWTMMLADPPISDGVFTGAGSGTCDFNGGTQLDALIAAEYFLDDWNFLGLDISDENLPATPVPDGYDRLFKTKLTPPNDPTNSAESTWGTVKKLYR